MCPFLYIFSLRIGTFGIFIGLALGAICGISYAQIRRLPNVQTIENQLMPAIPFMMLTGALFGCWLDAFFHAGWKGILHPFSHGMTYYGWLMGCLLFCLVYSRFRKWPPSFMLNLFLPTFALGQAFGRIGCFFGGCCFGIPCNAFGIRFPAGSFPYRTYGDTPLFPVQLCEGVYLFLLFALLMTKVQPRQRGAWYLILMPLGRFFWEFLRGDDRGSFLGMSWLSPAQVISIVFVAIGIGMLLHHCRQIPKADEGPPASC